MRILFVGDVMGRSGRDAVVTHIPALREKLALDAVIVNAENSAHGYGHTAKICDDFFACGVDCITSGNHVWGQREIIPYIETEARLIRPINYPSGTPGRGHTVINLAAGRKILVINALCRLFMEVLDDPFAVTQAVLSQYKMGKNGIQAIFIDIHGEASSEKQAFANYFDGHVSAVVGSHTHVPTADTRILPRGTGYQTDAGMTGDYDSVIGMKKEIAIAKFTRKMPTERLSPTDGPGTFCAVFIETNDQTGLCTRIAPIRLGPNLINISAVA
jgi:hypothetical protein